MIQANEHEILLHGDSATLLTEFSFIIRALLNAGISAEDIEFNFQAGFLNNTDEIQELAIARIMNKLKGLSDKDE